MNAVPALQANLQTAAISARRTSSVGREWRLASRTVRFSAICLVVFYLLAAASPFFASYDPTYQNREMPDCPPMSLHLSAPSDWSRGVVAHSSCVVETQAMPSGIAVSCTQLCLLSVLARLFLCQLGLCRFLVCQVGLVVGATLLRQRPPRSAHTARAGARGCARSGSASAIRSPCTRPLTLPLTRAGVRGYSPSRNGVRHA